jgi:TolB protein
MKNIVRVGLPLLLAAILLVAGQFTSSHAVSPTATASATPNTIVFSSRHSTYQIYTIQSDGTKLTLLSNNKFNETLPNWSPDGTQIAFTSDRDGNNEICLMNADGSNQHCITSNPTPNKRPSKSVPVDYYPVWSPDGQHIAFVSTRDGYPQVYSMNPDGSNVFNLSNSASDDDQPAWSPDLKTIAFTSDRDGNNEICLMDASGFNQRCITNNRTKDQKPNSTLPSDSLPAWSPDSQQLIFVSTRDHNNELYIMNADGSSPTNLTKKLSNDREGAMSPDKTQIAFVSNRAGAFEIFLMNPDGTAVSRLTKNQFESIEPDWMPNGTPATFEALTPTPTGTARTLVPSRTPTNTFPPPTRTFTPRPTNTWTATPPCSFNFQDFTASPGTIQAGASSVLKWDVDGVQTVFINGQGVTGHGSMTVSPKATTTYTLTLNCGGQTQAHSVTVTVVSPSVATPTATVVVPG